MMPRFKLEIMTYADVWWWQIAGTNLTRKQAAKLAAIRLRADCKAARIVELPNKQRTDADTTQEIDQ